MAFAIYIGLCVVAAAAGVVALSRAPMKSGAAL
jgi:hypothetical protein